MILLPFAKILSYTMNILKDKFLKLIDALPMVKAPKEALEYSVNPQESLSLYETEMKTRFTRIVNGDEKDDYWSSCCTDLGGLTYDGKHEVYIGNSAVYGFICNSRIKSAKEKIVKNLIKDMLPVISKMLKSGLTIGFIIWSHRTVVRFVVNKKLHSFLIRDQDLDKADFVKYNRISKTIGKTILIENLHYWNKKPTVPIQIFFCDTDFERKLPKSLSTRTKRVKEAENDIKANGRIVYIHAAFTHKLCAHKPILKDLLADLRDGAKIGAKGVVIHVGKNVDERSRDIAIARMEINIRGILKSVKPECPLLLETPAGQGNEILDNRNELIEFYGRFSEEERQLLKICVDTCHSDASGEEPLSYLQELDTKFPGCIVLVHFNDSKNHHGCKVDRHFPVGGGDEIIKAAIKTGNLPDTSIVGKLGYIGLRRMTEIAVWCNKKKIHMVTETA